MRKTVLVAIGLALGLGSASTFAQNLQMADPPSAQAPAPTPSRGMSMAQVEQRFGSPTERFAPVGQPPITRWVYPGFVVYFEHQHVVHAVASRAAAVR
jgi:hypothetical protein